LGQFFEAKIEVKSLGGDVFKELIAVFKIKEQLKTINLVFFYI
jgi:hypothetical protein